MTRTPDRTDRQILTLLLRNADMSKAELAKRLNIAASAVSERIKRLRQTGTIRAFETRIRPEILGYRTLAYIFITEKKPVKGVRTADRLTRIEGVEEVHKIAGEDCFLVKIRTRDTEELCRILDDEVSTIETVTGIRTTIVLRTLKEDVALGGVDSFEEPA
ncbi:MAG: Lrp/AsnC family transcriptional regulator [Alphaproteobacteria bacterium]